MPRPTWTPETPEQRRALRKLEQKAGRANEADEQMWEAAREAAELGVPITHIAKKTGRHRSTVHRHVPEQGSES